jgi:hypothetical protein
MDPDPEMGFVMFAVSTWLKLIVPVPNPNVIVGVEIVPAVSFPPREPIFRVPADPTSEAMIMPPKA